MNKSVIRLENIKKQYKENIVLNNFSLNINKGEFVTVIGSSGCGKTTILKLINGLLKPEQGKVFINGIDISKANVIDIRRSIGYVVQGIGLFPHMNVRNNVGYILKLKNMKDKDVIDEKVKKLIKLVGLEESIIKRYPSELSGGQSQRVGIARALIAEPEILIMDEPFGAVDEITRKLLQEAIYGIYKECKITIVFVTHDIREALKLGTRVIVMDKGEIVQDGTPEELRKKPTTDFVKKLMEG